MLLPFPLFAADEAKEVHVIEETLAGGTHTQLRDQTLLTGGDYTTQTAPAISGQIFTHWSISRTQAFVNRDRLGRAKDSVTYHLYEPTTLTANYLPQAEDTDNDGVADGYEIYWYGDLDETASSDTDSDGMTFAEELAAGTNPLIPNDSVEGGIAWNDGIQLQYNPDGLESYTIRSEPEGVLFATITDYAIPGRSLTTPTCNHLTTMFAYWTCNGVRLQDRLGRALDGITFSMPNEAVEYVAVCVNDAEVREQYYWYGGETGMSSDSDGDGMTFAEEIAAGTNPLIPNESVEGGIVWNEGDLLQYNIDDFQTYTIRSEPEGVLFATVTDIVKTGTALSTPLCHHSTTKFAYWTLNGVRQQDRYGRAYDQVNFAMPSEAVEVIAVCVDSEDARQQQYWYGAAMSMTSDTDGDGMTLAEEVAAGTNPLIPNESVEGGIVWDDGAYLETDLQVYEQALGAIVGGQYTELFTSPVAGNGGTSATFGANLQPVVADLNGDGRFDIVLVSDGGQSAYLNVGTSGNPEFRVADATEGFPGVDLAMNSTAKLDALDLDIKPVGALSATTNGTALLVSDADGRIWYYLAQPSPLTSSPSSPSHPLTSSPSHPLTFVLQHKVWGGSYDGFANGLRLAAVDWEDDGDLDCLCGTAEGKLILLRNPKVGRPTNVKALTGADNVKLTWDPNPQSRIRGYRVYRKDANDESDESDWVPLSFESFGAFLSLTTPLPTYRDYPPSVADYDYKVSSVSRFYTAGNSTPTVSESPATLPVRAELGRVTLHWTDVVAKRGEPFTVMLSIDNSANLSPENMKIDIDYDHDVLRLVKVVPNGLFDGDRIAPGGGKLYEYVFEILEKTETAEVTETTVSLTSATMYAASGAEVSVTLPTSSARIEISDDAHPAYMLGDLDGDGDVDKDDQKLLARFKQGSVKYEDWQLKAGDFNGNGKLDNADYQALRDWLKGK